MNPITGAQHIKPQDSIKVLEHEWPGIPVLKVRTFNILHGRCDVHTIQELLDIDPEVVAATRNAGFTTVEQVRCYQQNIPALLMPEHQTITFTVDDVSPGKRGFRTFVGEGELDNGVPFTLTSASTALYLTLTLPHGRVEQRLDLEALVETWGNSLIKKETP